MLTRADRNWRFECVSTEVLAPICAQSASIKVKKLLHGTRTVAMQAKMCQTLRRDQQLTVKTIQNKENSAKTQSEGSSPFTIPPNKRALQKSLQSKEIRDT